MVPGAINKDTNNRLPDVSVIIPTYNNENTLEDVIKSVLAQEYAGDIEIVLVEDYPEGKVSEKLANRYNLKLIRNEKNMGFGHSVNEGVRSSKYDIACILHDDIILPDKKWLSALVPYLFPDESVVMVTSPTMIPDKLWERMSFFEKALYAWMPFYWKRDKGSKILIIQIAHSDAKNDIYKKEKFLEVGGFDADTYRVACEDFDLSERLRRKGYKFLSIPVPVYHMQSSPRSNSARKILKKNAQISEGQGVLFRRFRFLTGLHNQLVKTASILFLIIPFNPVRLIGLLYILAVIFGYSFIAYREMKDLKVLALLPPVKLADFILVTIYFWKGFITNKQRL